MAGCGIQSMQLIFKTDMSIYQSKVKLDQTILFFKIAQVYDPNIRKMPERGLYGNREFHIPFWSMIYLALTFKFNAIVSFKKISILIASKSWTRTELGILVPTQTRLAPSLFRGISALRNIVTSARAHGLILLYHGIDLEQVYIKTSLQHFPNF